MQIKINQSEPSQIPELPKKPSPLPSDHIGINKINNFSKSPSNPARKTRIFSASVSNPTTAKMTQLSKNWKVESGPSQKRLTNQHEEHLLLSDLTKKPKRLT